MFLSVCPHQTQMSFRSGGKSQLSAVACFYYQIAVAVGHRCRSWLHKDTQLDLWNYVVSQCKKKTKCQVWQVWDAYFKMTFLTPIVTINILFLLVNLCMLIDSHSSFGANHCLLFISVQMLLQRLTPYCHWCVFGLGEQQQWFSGRGGGEDDSCSFWAGSRVYR